MSSFQICKEKKIQICYILSSRFLIWFQTFETQCIEEVVGGFLSLAIFIFIKEVISVMTLPGNPLSDPLCQLEGAKTEK